MPKESFKVRKPKGEHMSPFIPDIWQKPGVAIISAGTNNLTTHTKLLGYHNSMADSVRSKLPK